MPALKKYSSELAEKEYQIVRRLEDGAFMFRQTNQEFEKFKFIDQKHYDLLGDIMIGWIQAYLVDYYNMICVEVPFKEELKEGKAQAPIFKSEDWETNTERALVLIQGTGDVRAGIWARSVCMNDTLDLGSKILDVHFAKENGFSVIVLNPNYNKDPDGIMVDNEIRGMNHHCNYVWKHFVENGACPAKEIFVVAHSAGGRCIHEIIVNNEQTMIDKVRAIALTDACHGDFARELSKTGKEWAKESCIAYDASKLPLDHPLERKYGKTRFLEVSAGHPKHVYTTGCARESYLNWFLERSETIKDKKTSETT